MKTITLKKDVKLYLSPWEPSGFRDVRPSISLKKGDKVYYLCTEQDEQKRHKVWTIIEGSAYETFKYKQKCCFCNSFSTQYKGEYGAPGYGDSYKCNNCKKKFAVYAGKAESHARILRPEQVI